MIFNELQSTLLNPHNPVSHNDLKAGGTYGKIAIFAAKHKMRKNLDEISTFVEESYKNRPPESQLKPLEGPMNDIIKEFEQSAEQDFQAGIALMNALAGNHGKAIAIIEDKITKADPYIGIARVLSDIDDKEGA